MKLLNLICRVDKVAWEARQNPQVKQAAINYIRLAVNRMSKTNPEMAEFYSEYLAELVDLPRELG